MMDNQQMITVQEIITQWMKHQERELKKLLVNIQFDNAKEFVALKPWAEDHGIDLEFTKIYTPLQNGVAEHLNKTLLEIARSLLLGMSILKCFWPYIVQMANFIKNWTVFLKGEDKLPYEALYGEEWDLSRF
jgi:transposase InsO family protein